MTRPIGPRESAMRAQREENAKAQEAVTRKLSVADLAAKLPETTGVRPIKRKAKPRGKK